jgi:hypothetical protein
VFGLHGCSLVPRSPSVQRVGKPFRYDGHWPVA